MQITTETELCGVVTFPLILPTSITRCGALMEDPLLITVLPGASPGSVRLEPVPSACVGLHTWESDLWVVREQLL